MEKDIGLSIREANDFFASRKVELKENVDKNESSLKKAIDFFSVGIQEDEKKSKIKDFKYALQKENIDYSISLMDKLNLELSIMTTDIKQILPSSSELVDRYNRFVKDFVVALPKTKEYSELLRADNVEQIRNCINTLREHCDKVINMIETEFNKHYAGLFKNQDAELKEEIEQNKNEKFAEKELLISQYKTMFFECIVFFENIISEARKRKPK